MRLVIDVNVWVRATLGSSQIVAVLSRILDRRDVILSSDLLVRELAAVVRKPRLASHIDWDTYHQLVAFLGFCSEDVSISPPFPECRDADDGYLLAMASAGGADFLITFDEDLQLSDGLKRAEL